MNMRTIRAKIIARFPDRVAEVEDEGMDEGRFFVHLRAPWTYDEGYGIQRCRSFGGVREACMVLRGVQKEGEA
jgi:hypothetical protein